MPLLHTSRLRYVTLAICSLLLSGPVSGAAQVARAGPAGPLVQDVAKVRDLFDRGFARVERQAPSDTLGAKSPDRRLRELLRFRRDNVGWAELRGEAYLALHPMDRALAWMVVVPQGAPALQRMTGPLQLDPTTDALVLQIAPQLVSDAWAGVFLLHYLSLLADYSNSRPPYAQADYYPREWRAYQAELRAAEAISAGAVRRIIDGALEAAAVRTTDEFFLKLDTIYNGSRERVLASVTADPPRTHDEATLRNGFVILSLLIRHAERQGLSESDSAPLLQRVSAYLRERR